MAAAAQRLSRLQCQASHATWPLPRRALSSTAAAPQLRSIAQCLAFHAKRTPDAIAVTEAGGGLAERSVTYAELEERSSRLSHAYAAKLGAAAALGRIVTLALPNSIELLEAACAVWKLGGAPSPVSTSMPAAELQRVLKVADPCMIVGLTDGSSSPVSAMSIEGVPVIPQGFQPDNALPVTAPFGGAIVPPHYKAPLSGGSTGTPKVILSGQPGKFDPEANFLQLGQGGAILIPGPCSHNVPFMWSTHSLLQGKHVVLMRRFDAHEALRLLAAHRCDYVPLVPTMMHRIMQLDRRDRDAHDLSALRILFHVAAPCAPALKQAFIDWLGAERVHELYAGTEATGVTYITGSEWVERRGSVGRFINETEGAIFSEGGERLAAGQTGLVYMRLKETHPLYHAGGNYSYVGAPPASKLAGGWETVGDVGWMDEEGYLYLADRLADLILVGGRNVYPAEVESAILSLPTSQSHVRSGCSDILEDACTPTELVELPAVRSCAVIGRADDDLGNTVHAIVDVGEAALQQPDACKALVDALQAHLNAELSPYKLPRSFELVSTPLRDDAGKVRRSELRRQREASSYGKEGRGVLYHV